MSDGTKPRGQFVISNHSQYNLATWAQGINAKTLNGCRRTVPMALTHPCDVNGDQKGDLLLTGGAGWVTIPVGLSGGTGGFSDVNSVVSEFPIWARDPLAKAVSADFNNDGRPDIALVGGNEYVGSPRWTVPLAYSNANGTFTVTNFPIN
ncbi:MAG: VCBS repeat-containing protein [Deltaproteobacteria bacterium]|nr:VCBS repeat-containing protein [Deltaproteobacteria bacterium]